MNPELSRANDLYKQSQQSTGISLSLRRGHLETALVLYRSQLSKVNPQDRVSLLRNIGVASLRLGEILDNKFKLQLIVYHLSEAVSHLTMAWGMKNEYETPWSEKVEEYICDAFELACRSIDGDVESQRIPKFYLLDKVVKAIGDNKRWDFLRGKFHLTKGQYFFKCGVKMMEANNFKVTTQLIEYCRQEAECGLKYLPSNEKSSKNSRIEVESYIRSTVEIEILKNDIYFLQCSCESLRYRSQGDILFTKYMVEDDELNFDMMWEILDMYKTASLGAREKDLENEAIALARQGRMFDKVFKLKIQAKRYYREAFDLAEALQPRDLSKAAWFKECKNVLERYQKESLAEEEKKKATERAPFLEKLKVELEALKKVELKYDSYELLKHVYSAHPPRIGETKYNEKTVDSSNLRKTLLKAITQYHPDKQVQFGMEWKVLCEEITKCLTARYECMKGC